MDISIETLIGFAITIAGVVWRISELKNTLEKEFDLRVDSLREKISDLSNRIDLISQKIDNENVYLSNRINNLHGTSKGKILDLQHQFNEIVGFIEKISPDHKFIIRSRLMNKDTIPPDDESWTQIKQKK